MQVKVKLLTKDAQLPQYSRTGDAALDLTSVSISETDTQIVCGTGIAIEIPDEHVGLLFPRSSITKYDLLLHNSVGVIDSNYRGEIIFKFTKLKKDGNMYRVGDRIGQIIILPIPKIEPVLVDNLSDSNRGTDGFGSSGGLT